MAETKATPTPGPWLVDPLKIGTAFNIGTHDTDVALAAPIIGDALGVNEMRTANARLIAAAPEMYEALKEARREFYEDRHSFMSESEFLESVAFIDAVLAKAEGKP